MIIYSQKRSYGPHVVTIEIEEVPPDESARGDARRSEKLADYPGLRLRMHVPEELRRCLLPFDGEITVHDMYEVARDYVTYTARQYLLAIQKNWDDQREVEQRAQRVALWRAEADRRRTDEWYI